MFSVVCSVDDMGIGCLGVFVVKFEMLIIVLLFCFWKIGVMWCIMCIMFSRIRLRFVC